MSAAIFGLASEALAQSVTYSHDDAKMNQITVAEIGSGGLTPAFYYQLLHNSYQKSAAAKNKLAWLAEGEKVNAALENFERNIRRITEAGGSSREREFWEDCYRMYQCAVKAVQEAYMPNSERKKQYLRIHADIIRKNETLVRYLVRLANSVKVAELLDASATIEDRRAQIAMSAMNRWREAGWRIMGN